ncbi:unnamed protein product [Moneuplotes crassus]|uniref:Uncharacterized protein n=1 Tax=Euplotes crassus TaxID=5936 RepID=A0AAD1UEP4_EUPCR|nr:unnamed protein product [Moneuplotes crassus]
MQLCIKAKLCEKCVKIVGSEYFCSSSMDISLLSITILFVNTKSKLRKFETIESINLRI